MSVVEILLPQSGVEGEILAYDKAGKPVAAPHKIVISPYFFRSDSVANVLYMSVLAAIVEDSKTLTLGHNADEDEDITVQKAILQLPGTSGKLKVVDRSVRVTPKFAKPFLADEEEEEDDEGDGEGDDADYEDEDLDEEGEDDVEPDA